jgi:hypothetical protein
MKKLSDDPVWANIAPCAIHTQQGINFGGTGESLVEVRAVHDGKKGLSSRSVGRPHPLDAAHPLIKKEDGWHIIADGPSSMTSRDSTRTSSPSSSRP